MVEGERNTHRESNAGVFACAVRRPPYHLIAWRARAAGEIQQRNLLALPRLAGLEPERMAHAAFIQQLDVVHVELKIVNCRTSRQPEVNLQRLPARTGRAGNCGRQ